MAESSRSVIIDPAVLAERRARRAAEAGDGLPRLVPASRLSPSGDAAWAAPPPDGLAEAERGWRKRREALERELAGAARALVRVREEERAQREAVFAALESACADLRATRAAREADASAVVTLTAELEAERIAHAVARATAARLRAELAAARGAPAVSLRAELAAARGAPATGATAARVDTELAAARGAPAAAATAAGVGTEITAAPGAPAVGRTPAEPGRLVADLEAAAAALRAAAAPPAAELAPPADAAQPVAPSGDAEAPQPRHLRRALVALARDEPVAAGRLLVELARVQAVLPVETVSYDLTVRGLGTYAVTGGDVRRVPRARGRGEASFHLTADPLSLARLVAGEPVPIRRVLGRAKARGRVAALAPLTAAELSFTDALCAGARLEPRLVYAALPYVVVPAWTRGHAFTVAQQITEHSTRTWYVTARDGQRLAVTDEPLAEPQATVSMSRTAFDALLRGDPPRPGDRPAVRGDRAAVAALKGWTDRALRRRM